MLLENSGEVFQGSEKFTGAIKQYLCLSLLKNAASNISAAQTLTCSIFYTLLVKFRHALKAEVGVFFPMILLKAIEPPTPNTASTPACESLLVSFFDVQLHMLSHSPALLPRDVSAC